MENVEKIIVHRLSPYAFLPTKGSAGSAGYDLYSAYACKVPARGRALVMTDIQVIRKLTSIAKKKLANSPSKILKSKG